MTMSQPVWIRVAGNVKRIRTEGDPYHWRCFVRREGPEVALRSFRVDGVATGGNVIPGTDPAASNPLGLTAWIDFFGVMTVENDMALITLKPQ
ncbi:hypothetical protein HY633_03370 [Candidatus Uhrbacteria bacterium]|nr:hypothetical protein [Candidatus Uhrbacteria bacterium]